LQRLTLQLEPAHVSLHRYLTMNISL